MLHNDDRVARIVSSWPEAIQHHRPFGTVAVDVRDARATGLHQRSPKVVRAHRRLREPASGETQFNAAYFTQTRSPAEPELSPPQTPVVALAGSASGPTSAG
jgi:hypothetical protein